MVMGFLNPTYMYGTNFSLKGCCLGIWFVCVCLVFHKCLSSYHVYLPFHSSSRANEAADTTTAQPHVSDYMYILYRSATAKNSMLLILPVYVHMHLQHIFTVPRTQCTQCQCTGKLRVQWASGSRRPGNACRTCGVAAETKVCWVYMCMYSVMHVCALYFRILCACVLLYGTDRAQVHVHVYAQVLL